MQSRSNLGGVKTPLTAALVASLVVVCNQSRVVATTPLAQRNADATPIDCDELPEPPAWIAELMRRGDVALVHGPPDDPRRISGKRVTAAETAYEIEFDFRLRLRWRIDEDAIEVFIDDIDFQWQPVHTIWFRQLPAAESFWNERLVLHELDHVAISSHRSIRDTFQRRAGQLSPLEGEVRAEETPRQAAGRIAREAVKALFDDVSNLAKIRYVELDRQTDHGLQPIPAGSELRPFVGGR